MLDENLSEKTTTKIRVVSEVDVPDLELFVRLRDFEKLVLAVCFGSLLILLFSFVL